MQLDDLTDSQTEAFLAVIRQAMLVVHKAKYVGPVDHTQNLGGFFSAKQDCELFEVGLASELAALNEAIADLKNETIAAQKAPKVDPSPKRQGAKAHPISQHDRSFWRLFSGAS